MEAHVTIFSFLSLAFFFNNKEMEYNDGCICHQCLFLCKRLPFTNLKCKEIIIALLTDTVKVKLFNNVIPNDFLREDASNGWLIVPL